VTFVSNCYKKV